MIFAGALAPVLFASTALAQAAHSAPAQHSMTPASSAGAAASADQIAPPAHPLTVAQAHQLMELTGTGKVKEHLVQEINEFFEQRLPPNVPADVKTDLQSSLAKMDIDSQTVATYQKYLSTEDATKAIEFYQTPAGKDLLKATPILLGEVQKNAMQVGNTTVKGVIDRHRTEIEAAAKEFQQQHAAPAGGAGGPGGAPGGMSPSPAPAPANPPSAH